MRAYTRNKLVWGWGINDADYNTHVQITKGRYWTCPIYIKWSGALERTISEAYHAKQPTYVTASVDDRWKYFSAFKYWSDQQPTWDGCHLDKDILLPGNKIYSPETCCYVPQWLNNLATTSSSKSGLPLGVSYKPGSENATKVYYTQVGKINGGRYTSRSYTPQEAHVKYQLAKADQVEAAIEKYSLETCYREDVAEALYQRAETLRENARMGIETLR